MATATFTIDGIIREPYYRLGNMSLPRPTSFKRDFVDIKTDLQTLSGKTCRDVSYRKERFLMGWEMLTEDEADAITVEVERDQAVAFAITDGNLTLSEIDVWPFIASKNYVFVGDDYRVALNLELIEETAS